MTPSAEPVIICLCNGLCERRVGAALQDGARRPREVYAACGACAQCGRCTRAILALLRDPPARIPATA